jgi:hypothetical protein
VMPTTVSVAYPWLTATAHQPWPEIVRTPPNARRQGSVGKNSRTTRYVPSDEKKDQVVVKRPRTATDNMRDKARPKQGEGPQPTAKKAPPPEPRAPQSAPYPIGELAISYGKEGQDRYAPSDPFQAVVSLNMDSVRDQKDIFFADLHGLKAGVLLFQDHRMSEAEALGFIQNASRKVFRSEGRPCAVVSESPVALNMRRYGGAMVIVHPHYYGRVVARFTDARGPGRYAAVTLRGKNGVLITFIAVYLTPAPGGESGQDAAQRRYIARHTGKLAAREPYALAVLDLAELIEERHRAGSMIVLGGRPPDRYCRRLETAIPAPAATLGRSKHDSPLDDTRGYALGPRTRGLAAADLLQRGPCDTDRRHPSVRTANSSQMPRRVYCDGEGTPYEWVGPPRSDLTL